MKIRFRIGPFTFGSSGVRLSPWRGGTGFSVPLTNRNTSSFGKIKLGIFSFFFNDNDKNSRFNTPDPQQIQTIKKKHPEAYAPWSRKDDENLIILFRQGKTVKELSEKFRRSKGAIRSRINKLLLQ
jgi:hypothetical protein